MATLITTLGDLTAADLGMILPHEHIFADFISGDDGGVSIEQVLPVIEPAIKAAQQSGITALVDATAIGGARRVDILQAVSKTTGFPIVAATGIFKDPWKTDWVQKWGADWLRIWMIGELTEGIDNSGVRAGWIKLSASDNGLTHAERILVRAAAAAAHETGATIGSHTAKGKVALDQLDLIEDAGGRPDQFIWVHTHIEPDFELHLEVARRGAWIEYDAIGDQQQGSDTFHIQRILKLADAGLTDRLLLSHDIGGYNPRLPDGGPIPNYTYLLETFVPAMRTAGLDDDVITGLLMTNPFQAYAR